MLHPMLPKQQTSGKPSTYEISKELKHFITITKTLPRDSEQTANRISRLYFRCKNMRKKRAKITKQKNPQKSLFIFVDKLSRSCRFVI